MICTEFQELAAAYALGALDESELRAADEHLAQPQHSGCIEALRRAAGATELLARSLVPQRPDERVWRAIEAKLGLAATVKPGRSGREWLSWAVAAAAVVGFLLLNGARQREQLRANEGERAAVEARQQGERERQTCAHDILALRGQLELQKTALVLLELPSTHLVALGATKGQNVSALALINYQSKQGIVLSGNLTAEAGKDYQLWLIRGDQKIAAGLLRGTGGQVLASIDSALLAGAPPDAVAVSLEPFGGRPQPTEVVLVAALPKS